MEKITNIINVTLEELNKFSNIPREYRDDVINVFLRARFQNYPKYLTDEIINDFRFFIIYFEFIKKKLNKLVNKYDEIDNIKSKLFENYKNNTTEKKIKFINLNNAFIRWCDENDIIENYIGENKILLDLENLEINKIDSLELRPNQKDAFNRLERNGLETGIHCQATGSGKTFIILRYIDYIKKYKKNPKVILFTERKNILKDLFDFNDDTLKPSKNKLLHWKKLGIADLTKYKIIERVLTKNDKWMEELRKSKKPTLIVINRAYLTLGKKYRDLTKIDLILHDECHNTSSYQCHEFLKYCKYNLKSTIIGFSATPLRTGKKDVPKLKEIYGDNKGNLILLTDYNMLHAISNNLILPPNFYWYQMIENTKDKTQIVSQLELGSVLELLNHVVTLLPNKKIVAWCRTIELAKKWKELFEQNYEQRPNLHGFKFGIDTSKNNNNDYEIFKKSEGKHILFCANKHREGSDIKKLDGCIFLDKVKNRSSIPFIQSIGRVLRKDNDNLNKTFGMIIDGYVKNNGGYEKEFIDKIISYYLALQNLTDINEKVMETKYEKYIKLMNIIQFDKEKEVITMNLGNKKINIHCNRLPWEKIMSKFEPILQEKIKLSMDDNFRHKGKILKEKFGFHKNTDFVREYKKISQEDKEKYNLPDLEDDEFVDFLNKYSWFDFSDIMHNFYSYDEYKHLKKTNKFVERIPKYPQYIYKNINLVKNNNISLI